MSNDLATLVGMPLWIGFVVPIIVLIIIFYFALKYAPAIK